MAEAARRTTSRRDLSRDDRFGQLSPEVGVLDLEALDRMLRDDLDGALSLLAELVGATDERLRELARAAAGRIVVDLARRGPTSRRGVGRIVRRPPGAEGDVDLDASIDGLLRARVLGRAARVDDLVLSGWGRPDTALSLVVDRSGSMAGDRLAAAAVAAAALVTRAPADCSVVAFARDAIVVEGQHGQRPAERVVDDVLRLRGVGVTDLDLALRTAADQLRSSRASRKVAVLMSDCRSTAGPDPRPAAAALGELVVLAPTDDAEDAVAFGRSVGATVVHVDGPGAVPDALAELLVERSGPV